MTIKEIIEDLETMANKWPDAKVTFWYMLDDETDSVELNYEGVVGTSKRITVELSLK